jgi:hypothetical protein
MMFLEIMMMLLNHEVLKVLGGGGEVGGGGGWRHYTIVSRPHPCTISVLENSQVLK